MNTLEALWVVTVSRFIIFHWNEITYCNCLSVTGQHIWQRKAFVSGEQEAEGRGWTEPNSAQIFCGKGVGGERNQRWRERKGSSPFFLHSILRHLWPNDLNWASVWEQKGRSRLTLGDALGWWEHCSVERASATVAQQVLDSIQYCISQRHWCWGITRQQERQPCTLQKYKAGKEMSHLGLLAFGWLSLSS